MQLRYRNTAERALKRAISARERQQIIKAFNASMQATYYEKEEHWQLPHEI